MRTGFPLLPVAVAHLVVAVACVAWLVVEAAPIGGLHPAIKPLKFAVSIAVLLGTLAFVVDALAVAPAIRSAACWALAATMVVEMAAIVTQALRGRASHFNTSTPLDAILWHAMLGAIVIALVVLVAIAVVATVRPLELSPRVAAAVRIALWLLLIAAVSGFAMGGRSQHSVGGADGGPGMPVTGWSRHHGDLRVSHFFALHALQVLPGAALLLDRLPLGGPARWSALVALAIGWAAVVIGTLLQAFAGLPLRD